MECIASSYQLDVVSAEVDGEAHFRVNHLRNRPFHRMQFTYQSDKYTVIALDHLVKEIEKAFDHK